MPVQEQYTLSAYNVSSKQTAPEPKYVSHNTLFEQLTLAQNTQPLSQKTEPWREQQPILVVTVAPDSFLEVHS